RSFAQLDAAPALEALRRSEQKLGDALALSGDSSRVRTQIEAAKAEHEQLVGDLALVRSRVGELGLQIERAEKVLASGPADDGDWLERVPAALRGHELLGGLLETVSTGSCPASEEISNAFAEVKLQLASQLSELTARRQE